MRMTDLFPEWDTVPPQKRSALIAQRLEEIGGLDLMRKRHGLQEVTAKLSTTRSELVWDYVRELERRLMYFERASR